LSTPQFLSWRQLWLEQARELPAADVYFAPIVLRQVKLELIPAQAQFVVTKRGSAREIEVQVLLEGREGFAGQLSRWLKSARFRPAMADREILDRAPLQRNYTIMD
jgi:hypothetical protein